MSSVGLSTCSLSLVDFRKSSQHSGHQCSSKYTSSHPGFPSPYVSASVIATANRSLSSHHQDSSHFLAVSPNFHVRQCSIITDPFGLKFEYFLLINLILASALVEKL